MTRTPRGHRPAPAGRTAQAGDEMPLRHRRFVERYLANGLNATQAAKDAGFSAKTAGEQGSRLLKNVKVREAIDRALEKAGARDYLRTARILRQLGRIAYGDPRKFFDEKGRLLPVHKLDDEAAALVAGFEVVTRVIPGTDPVEVEYVHKYKLRETTRALELLGKYKRLKLWTETVEHKGKVTLEELVAGSMREETEG